MVEIEGRLHAACPEDKPTDKPIFKTGYDKIKSVSDFLKNNKVLAYGHSRACECEYLYVHEKGNKDIFAIMKVEDVLNRDEVTNDMRPPTWKPIEDLDLDKFFLISKVSFKEIPFNELTDRNGIELNPNALNDMIWVVADINDEYL